MDVIIRPLLTEKMMAQMEKENKLMFIVARQATKASIKREVEKLYAEKVKEINTQISRAGDKRAYVKFQRASAALDIATKLGVM
jgi:large subunit ribosomal protein L23